MSIAALNAAFGLGPHINGARRLVLIALCDAADDEHYECWPSRRTIARKAGIRRLETVTEHLTWLERNGYIERRVNAWVGSRGQIPEGKRPNVYAVLFHRGGGGYTDSGEGGYTDSGEENHHCEPPSESPRAAPHSRQEGAQPSKAAAGGWTQQQIDELTTQLETDPEIRDPKKVAEHRARHDPPPQAGGGWGTAIDPWPGPPGPPPTADPAADAEYWGRSG